MQVTRNDYRRTFITAEDMIHAMTNSGDIIGICPCTVEISKQRMARVIISPVLMFARTRFMKRIFYKPDLVVITAAKTYFFTNIFWNQKNSQYSFKKIYRIDNAAITRKKNSTPVAIRIGLPGNYSAKLIPGFFKKSILFPNTAINIDQVDTLLFGQEQSII